MIGPIPRWFEIPQYEDKISISITNLVETTWLYRYPRSIEITYDQWKEFIGIEFIKPLIEIEYGVASKPSTSGNPMPNVVLESIHQVLVNLVRTFNISTHNYVDQNYLWTVILAASVFSISSTNNRQKGYSLGQLIFFHNIILLIKHRVNWELIREQKQT